MWWLEGGNLRHKELRSYLYPRSKKAVKCYNKVLEFYELVLL